MVGPAAKTPAILPNTKGSAAVPRLLISSRTEDLRIIAERTILRLLPSASLALNARNKELQKTVRLHFDTDFSVGLHFINTFDDVSVAV